MEEQKLRQLFKNRSNCYVDTDDVVQGMDENCFVETVNEALRLHDVSGRSELLFAFIAEIKREFKDENWDYLDFIAERVLKANNSR
jgi:hypothetical protein